MSESAFERCFFSQRGNVKPVVIETLNHLRSYVPSLSKEAEDELRLVFSELLYNAVIHGNKEDKEKLVNVRVEINNGCLEGVISDQGMGFDHKKLFSSFSGLDNKLESEHGRGILLAASLVEDLSYNDKGNVIRFYKKVLMMVEPNG